MCLPKNCNRPGTATLKYNAFACTVCFPAGPTRPGKGDDFEMSYLTEIAWLLPLGILVGMIGTLIGAGGGFILIPILIFTRPDFTPADLTTIAMIVILANSASGTLAYARMKRIDYRSGVQFALAAVPGAFFGAFLTRYIPRRGFDLAFGLLMVAASAFLVFKPKGQSAPHETQGRFIVKRIILDAQGLRHEFSFNPWIGIGVSVVVGVISNILGIGGGIIHVPIMVHVLNFPVHLATATSHFVLVFTSLAGTGEHLVSGDLPRVWDKAIPLAVGAVIGAQFGAALARRIHGRWILVGLAGALAIAGVRIFLRSL